MTHADDLKAEITVAIDRAERVQATALMYEQAVKEMQGAVLLLDLHADNSYSRSCARMAPLIASDLPEDNEITGQIKSNLQEWYERL